MLTPISKPKYRIGAILRYFNTKGGQDEDNGKIITVETASTTTFYGEVVFIYNGAFFECNLFPIPIKCHVKTKVLF